MSSDFRDRFGLAWKYPQRASRPDPEGTSTAGGQGPEHTEVFSRALEDAVAFHARPFLEVLRSSPHKTARLFDIADRINVKVDMAIPVQRYLLSQGFVTRMGEDKLGNDEIRLTDLGEMKLG
jgi:hypothetical protein